MLLGALGLLLLFFLSIAITDSGAAIDRGEAAVARQVAPLRDAALTSVARAVSELGSTLTIGVLRWATLIILIAFKRFRHLFVFIGSLLLVGWLTTQLSLVFVRARPLGIEILGHWQGSAMPSKPVAALAVTLIAMIYSLITPGRYRNLSKWVAGTLLVALAASRLYLGVDHLTDILVAVVLGMTIPVIAFRTLTPNDVFPVSYRRGRAAHLDIEGLRGAAIKRALEEQLGIKVLDMKPFGLIGSGGSTPLRLRVAGKKDTYLFAKLYAQTHLRADRWYKLGRTLLYGRLEDEGAFSTVRRLVQYEDYMLRAMVDAGISVPRSHGFIEITPEREYLIVTDFVDDAQEILEAEVDNDIIDDALATVRALWDGGMAHRDIKPSNILVRDGKIHLIDVAFAQTRPSPWRQAVDLANMMLVLAFRSDAERVYERAVKLFTPEEIAEAFAATRGMTIPSQSRSLLRKERRDLVARFRELAPRHPPISIQRWSYRRVLLTCGVVLASSIAILLIAQNLRGAGLVSAPAATQGSYALVTRMPVCDQLFGEQLVLEAQSVPSATHLPCITALPLGWSFGALDVQDGSSKLYLNSDRAGMHSFSATLTRACDVSKAKRVPSDLVGIQRYENIKELDNRYVGVRYYVFSGGCVTYDFDFEGTGRTALANEATVGMSLVSRRDVARLLYETSGIRL